MAKNHSTVVECPPLPSRVCICIPSDGRSALWKSVRLSSRCRCMFSMTLLCGAKIQLLDLPGIIEGAKDGKGRGRQAGGLSRTSTRPTLNLFLILSVSV
jgi:hypothetical protein